MGDVVDSGIRLSYRPVSLCRLAGDNPMPEQTSVLTIMIKTCHQYVKKMKESGVVSECCLPDSGASNTSENLLSSLLENGEGVVALFVEDFEAGISLD
jgi:hypothetical protein